MGSLESGHYEAPIRLESELFTLESDESEGYRIAPRTRFFCVVAETCHVTSLIAAVGERLDLLTATTAQAHVVALGRISQRLHLRDI